MGSSVSPPRTVMGEDGLNMILIPGGELRISPDYSGTLRETVQVHSFYMDETKVTNHHYVEFLSAVQDTLSVENGVVRRNGEILLYLGEASEPNWQIIYRHNLFHLREAKYAARPVARVTWYGALAYAHHYGKRLPTEYEWEYIASSGSSPGATSSRNKPAGSSRGDGQAPGRPGEDMMEMMRSMMEMHSQPWEKSTEVTRPPANLSLGETLGLKEIEGKIREWVRRARAGNLQSGVSPAAVEKASYRSLIVGKPWRPGSASKSFSYPWEGYPDVGFRCVLDIQPG